MSKGAGAGFVSSFALIGGAIVLATDKWDVFFNVGGISMVVGGVMATAFISYPIRDLKKITQALWIVLTRDKADVGDIVRDIQALAALISREGLDAVDEQLDKIEHPFLRDGVEMVLDQMEPDEIGMVMERRIEMTLDRELAEARLLSTLSKFAPAFGMIGTVIGLIIMMMNLDMDHFDQLGQGLATALTTTFYGLLLANLLFSPLANRLEARAEERAAEMRIITEGVTLLAKRMPATLVHHRLLAFIPPRMWSDIPSAEVTAQVMSGSLN